MILESLYQNLKGLDLMAISADILENELGEFIADLNRKQMAEKGQRSDGSQFDKEYADLTKHIKSNKSGTAGIYEYITLFDTGDLHKSIFTSVPKDAIILDSKDWKISELIDKYGEFLGLTPESQNELKAKFMPIFNKRVQDEILK